MSSLHQDQSVLMQAVFDVAVESGLFDSKDIKVRVRVYADFIVGESNGDFLHVFAYIMEGRSVSQRKVLSESVVAALAKLIPSVEVVSMNVMEFEKATYTNRTMLDL